MKNLQQKETVTFGTDIVSNVEIDPRLLRIRRPKFKNQRRGGIILNTNTRTTNNSLNLNLSNTN